MLLSALVAAPAAAAEEFHMKDGSKVVGKIIAYEKDSFRVETSFGVAIIYKDRVARIVFSEGESREAAAPASLRAEPAPARATPPPPPPLPATIEEQVSGTAYLNETYRFQLFKPPTWRSYPQLVRPQTPLVAALGTPDETTLLLIGREYYNGPLPDYVRLAERSLQRLYENYRREEESPTQIGGVPAVERHFTGEAEGRYWTGTAIYFARGQLHFTLLGLTSAGEQTPFQQAVLKRVYSSLEFLPEEGRAQPR
ncbi:MAG: hypothetical protein ACRD4D_06355 [Candidatus Acidiferrales bacterium]